MLSTEMIATEAWVLPQAPAPARLNLNEYRFPYDPAREVLLEPLLGCWEANMGHALEREPVDVCALRRESPVVLGNAGVVRVRHAGPRQDLQEGSLCVMLSFSDIPHPLGFPRSAHAYDAPGTVGLLARRSKCLPHQLLKLPADLERKNDENALARWAAWALRYVTAWGNWEIAHGSYQLLAGESTTRPWALAWGGGVAFAELLLAKAAGYQVAMLTSRRSRAELLRAYGIHPLMRHDDDPQTLAEIQALLGPQGAAILIDLIGEPVLRLSLKVLGCPGILTTAGWKAGMHLRYQRALACMHWQSFVHTHYARPDQAQAAFVYAQEQNWLPPVGEIWGWQDIPRLAEAYQAGLDDYFPVYRVNAL